MALFPVHVTQRSEPDLQKHELVGKHRMIARRDLLGQQQCVSNSG